MDREKGNPGLEKEWGVQKIVYWQDREDKCWAPDISNLSRPQLFSYAGFNFSLLSPVGAFNVHANLICINYYI
jgi:hypothetical protein